jgi:hypothetical protein
LLSDSSHELHVECLGEVVHVLAEVRHARVNLDLVFPLVISPLLFEIELRAIRRLQLVNEVDLDLVQVNDVLDVATG